MKNDNPNARWARRRAEELGGCYAVRIGQKYFAVRNGELVEVPKDKLLERTWDGTHGVAPT